jgi:hypothetical protein
MTQQTQNHLLVASYLTNYFGAYYFGPIRWVPCSKNRISVELFYVQKNKGPEQWNRATEKGTLGQLIEVRGRRK